MWNYSQPVHVVFGENVCADLSAHLEAKGIDRAILVADPAASRLGVAQQLQNTSKGRILGIVDEVEPNPTLDNIEKCAQRARELGVDAVVAVGGGSAMDCGKSVAAVLAMSCTARELLEGKAITAALPVVAIPTTAGTGSEVTAGAVLSDPEKSLKSAIFSPVIFPKLALVDPRLTYTCPAKVTSSSGMDVLMHAIDALSSVKASPVTDALAMAAIRLALKNLRTAVSDGSNKEARSNMSQASVLAGLAFSQTGTTGSHACSYILTAKYNLPHGVACAFTADAWLIHNAKARPVINDYARELGFSGVEAFAQELGCLKTEFGMPITLQDAGIDPADIGEIVDATNAAAGNIFNNVAKLDDASLANIFSSKK